MLRYFIVFLLPSTYCIAQPPLSDEGFRTVLNSFTAAAQMKYETYSLPKGLNLKSLLSLHLESMQSSQDKSVTNYRKSQLLIKAALDSNPDILTPIGQVVLIENTINPGIDGKFSLHFINIMPQYQGKGYGSTALNLSIMLAQNLASHSDFYDRMNLQCSDYDGENHLGNMPTRLSYYLNHGFQIDPTTLGYIRHLDSRYFVQSFDASNFIAFLQEYDQENSSIRHNLPLKSYIPYAETILKRLKEMYAKATPLSQDAILQIAESSSSDASQCVLDRLYYDPTLDDETQGKTGEFLYKMHLDVKEWNQAVAKRKHLLSNRKKSKSRNRYNKYNPLEINDLLVNIFYIYTQFIDNRSEEFKIVTDFGDEGRSTKIRKGGSSDDTLGSGFM